MTTWKCLECGEEIEISGRNEPAICHNPNCENKVNFERVHKLENINPPELAKNPEILEEIKDTLETDIRKDEKTALTVFHAMISAYSRDPLNLFLSGPSSTGKSYAATNVAQYFPDKDLTMLGDLSPKALVHQHGQMIDENGNPINPPGEDADEDKKAEYKEKLKGAKNLVNLQNKILVFLEEPHPKTLEMLKPILSHDTPEHEYKFAESTSSGIHSDTTIIRGWPAAIFCTANPEFKEEMATRSLTITPKMSGEKYRAANEKTAVEKALPITGEKTENDKEELREFIKVVREIMHLCKIATPFAEKLVKKYPSSVARDMRDFGKFLTLIQMNTLIHAFQRPAVKVGDTYLLLSTIGDLQEAEEIFSNALETTRSGLTGNVVQVYKKVFWKERGNDPCFSELAKKFREVKGQSISSEGIKGGYIEPLEAAGWIDVTDDPQDGRKKQVNMLKKPKEIQKKTTYTSLDLIDEQSLKEWYNNLQQKVNPEKMCIGGSITDFCNGATPSNARLNTFLNRYRAANPEPSEIKANKPNVGNFWISLEGWPLCEQGDSTHLKQDNWAELGEIEKLGTQDRSQQDNIEALKEIRRELEGEDNIRESLKQEAKAEGISAEFVDLCLNNGKIIA